MEKLRRLYGEMTRSQKKDLHRILTGAGIFILGEVLSALVPFFDGYGGLLIFLPAWLILGFGVLKEAVLNIKNGQVFDENFLMCIASIGAFFTGDYGEAVAVMLFYQVGELFEHCAVDRSRRSITELMNLAPDVAYVRRDGEIV